MPIVPRRWPSLTAAAAVVGVLVLNGAIATGAEALTADIRAATAPSAPATPAPTPAATPTPTPSATASPTPSAPPSPSPTPLPEPVATAISSTSGGTADRKSVVLTGTAMANVARVVVGDRDAEQLTLLSPTELRVTIPEAADFVPGSARILLVSASDDAWTTTPFTWTWSVRSDVDREMAYAATHWDLRTSARYGYIPKNDCVNFVSQLLEARGWHESSVWWNDGTYKHTVKVKKTVLVPTKVPVTTTALVKGKKITTTTVKTVKKKVVKRVKKVLTLVSASATWVSSTAMSDWLATRHDLATHLSYAQRSQVRVGDIVQFNWTGSGSDWDHTAVVSRIVVAPNGSEQIWYAEHTNHQLYGGSIGLLLSTPEYRHMRVQFWHLKH